MSGVNTILQTALDTRLASSVSIPIAYNNVEFLPVQGQPFVRPTLLPAATINRQLDGLYEHKGIYQIDVYVPSGSGIDTLYSLLDSITTGFKSNLTLTTNCYVQCIGRGRSERQDAWFTSYIQIDYLFYYN